MTNSYEVMLILPEALSDDRIDKAIKAFTNEAKSLKGKCSSPSRLGRKTFARPQQKHTAGEFVLLNMDMPTKNVAVLRENLRLNEDLFRISIFNKASTAPVSAPTPETADAE